ncbi:MAG: KpsF/GutQ family sugar-phosphate isomerase [Lentisphaeria bacterium]|jgi:arabinose-5-phosphate isomerase|nr:KpsF/GutQ family sugar-phosphate isomerase [Lentisphaerota bacterium]MBO5693962.1 KpsF/GutQ family sugar-phosphate isomerase [Lentisphaeria bacterium]MBO5803118.1 KpsF/GutQ family sugar-phosphate isomerase [Lentisphaeria bacterium]
MDTPDQIIKKAQAVLQTEIEGIEAIKQQLDNNFVELVAACIKTLDNGGKIVITGVGKSGHIGSKMAATLASTGSTAIFMHPVEAMHGDLGMLQENDIMIALSYSGETQELTRMIIPAKRLGVPVACFTGIPESTLAKLSDIVVIGAVEKEACPFNLAPTTTSTAHLALGDALAMVLLQERKFTKEDYGRRHPGGAIGRAVTMRVSDLMRKPEAIVLAKPDDLVKNTLVRMTAARCGSAIIVDAEKKLLGIFTDGDFRRRVENDLSILNRPMEEVMTRNPIFIKKESLAVEILKILEKRKIDDLVVLEEDGCTVAGLVDIQDLPGFKLM